MVCSADGYNHQVHWAPTGHPIHKSTRWDSQKPTVVFGVISATRGLVHWHLGTSSFTGEDIADAIEEVRAKIGDGVKLAMMWDNARIHYAKEVQRLMASPEIAMENVWNCTARPDCATLGIERTWSKAKAIYRCHVDRYKALNQPFNNMGLVQFVLGKIDNDFIKKMAVLSVPAVMAA